MKFMFKLQLKFQDYYNLQRKSESGESMLPTIIAIALLGPLSMVIASTFANITKERVMTVDRYEKYLAEKFVLNNFDCRQSLQTVSTPCSANLPITAKSADGKTLLAAAGRKMGHFTFKAECTGTEVVTKAKRENEVTWKPVSSYSITCPEVSYNFSMVLGPNPKKTLLRNSTYLYAAGYLTKPGLPNGNPPAGLCFGHDVIAIKNTLSNRQRVCNVMHPGSYVKTYSATTPNWAGWVDAYAVTGGYCNLYIGDWTGATWTKQCHKGLDCYYSGIPFLTNITCALPL